MIDAYLKFWLYAVLFLASSAILIALLMLLVMLGAGFIGHITGREEREDA